MTLDETLRSLDAATPLTDAQRRRAASTLDHIISTPPERVRRPRRRLVLATAAGVVAVAGAAFVLPGGVGGGRAYASWTPTPAPLTDAEIALIAPECQDRLGGSRVLDLARAKLVLAERRGEYAVLLYRTDNPDVSGACLAHHVAGSDDVDDVASGVTGSSGPALTAPPRGYTQGGIADFGDASITDGAVGADVTGVTVHARNLSVQASVANGRYVAWWPGPAFDHDAPRPSGEAGPTLFITYDLTLRDGTVIPDAQPDRPR
ncbi:hypothetical protein [Asanoa siamensis]|uniref:DUF4179 domain-containing protein n=1 Tax=Asanoa siamensis TaxID=926357 RepID=A0ABQ4CX84_9ACTN|nr:hypothetical protein [Asanoa siamensis]GIF75891.1 hypothetical protein Asi02nite_54090 [Asanoa siamensis]